MNKVTGRSEFELPIALPIDQVVATAQGVLNGYLRLPDLISAEAAPVNARQFTIELTFRSDSFAEAEELMNEIATSIFAALRGTKAGTLEKGVTELISA